MFPLQKTITMQHFYSCGRLKDDLPLSEECWLSDIEIVHKDNVEYYIVPDCVIDAAAQVVKDANKVLYEYINERHAAISIKEKDRDDKRI